MNARRQRWRDEFAIAAVLALTACLLAVGGWAWRLDRVVYDLGLALWSRPPPPGIVIMAIDDASIGAIGRWPWRRAVHATLLEKLAAAKPRAVVLDLVLTESDPDPEQDRLLAAAMRRAAPLVLPLLDTLPAPALRDAALLGMAEPTVDADGVLRHAFLRAGPTGALRPHLALALLQAGGESVHPRLHALPSPGAVPGSRWQHDGELLVRFAGPPGTVERVSYVDVLTGVVPPERLAGRYVLIGMTAQGLGDTLATPVNERHQAMPGIEVHANILYTLRSGDTVRALVEPQVAALSCALLAALLLCFRLFGTRLALPLALSSVPLAVLASLLALGAGWWCSPVPYAVPAVLAYPLWSWRRLQRTMAGLDGEIGRLAAEPAVADAQASSAAADDGGDAIDTRLQTLQNAGAAVRQARRFLADSLAAMPTAMLVADELGRVQLANPKAAAMFEVDTAEDMQGLDLVRLLGEINTATPFDWPAALAALPQQGGSIAVEGRLAAAGEFIVHVAAVSSQGLRRLIVTVASVEPIKQAQREREEVLAFVSHDLRSPASSIVLLADLQLAGRLNTPPAELLQEVRRLAARTLEMSEDFVRTAQVQTRPLNKTAVAPAALLSDALADLRAQAMAADVTLLVDVGEDAAPVALDRALVTRAVANLVSNALKHSARGASVQLQAEVAEGALRVRVQDSGPGLSPEQVAQLGRGDQGVAVQEARGVGLGLLFVQRVAQRHGGTLRVLPAPRSGAHLELELPARSANP